MKAIVEAAYDLDQESQLQCYGESRRSLSSTFVEKVLNGYKASIPL